MKGRKLFVAQTKRTDKGLFAGKDFRKNQRITAFEGKLKKYDYNVRYDIGERWLAVGNNVWIAPPKSTPGYYINHSCRPNAGLKGRATVVAMRHIKTGEEITLDYAITEDDPFWKMRCCCGQPGCRKVIRGVRSLSPALYKKYSPFIRPFLRKAWRQTPI